jgi:hypothetical protein
MKLLLILLFAYLITPGSGHLIWDGLPMSTRAEVFGLVLLAVVVLTTKMRQHITSYQTRFRWGGLVSPLLVVVTLIKFLTFGWMPVGDGFTACYRSLYHQLDDEQACEKSFDAPIIQGSGRQYANMSRVDQTVDFGEFPYDWSLPFMNEFPRLGSLWLERFPFRATYSAVINENGESSQVIPIQAIGELTVAVNSNLKLRKVNYDRHFLATVELPPRRSDLRVIYQYRDDDLVETPDTAPLPRGPYAELKIGEPMSVAGLAELSRVRVTGSVTGLDRALLTGLTVRNRDGSVVEFVDINATRDAQDDPDQLLRRFDLEIEIPAVSLASAPLRITTETSNLLGIIINDPSSPLTPLIQQTPASTAAIQLSATLTTDRDSLIALAPKARDTPGPALRILLVLLDLVTLLIVAAMAVVIVRTLRSAFALSLGLAAIAWLAVEPLDAILPAFVGGGRELVIPYALIALLIVAARRYVNKYPLPFLLPITIVLATQKVFEHLHYNHPGHSNRWWGNLLYQWRDSDWFTNHGHARSVFTESILRGGEDVFYVRVAPRYLLFSLQLLFGENDVLIGLISLSIGFLIVCTIAGYVASRGRDVLSSWIGVITAFTGMILLGDQIITAFGFFITSEFVSWVILFGAILLVVKTEVEQSRWATYSFAFLTAIMVQFRPNTLFVAIALLVLYLHRIAQSPKRLTAAEAAWAVSLFVSVLGLSLLHNVYYGARFVPFTEVNVGQVVNFSWGSIWSQKGVLGALQTILRQFQALMYWRIPEGLDWSLPHDANFAIAFWGAQVVLLIAIANRVRLKSFSMRDTFIALLPLAYVVPMLNFNLPSYFPRHLVAVHILCLGSGLLLLPRGVAIRHSTEKCFVSR